MKGNSSASLRALIRSLLLPSFNKNILWRIADHQPGDVGLQKVV